MREPVSHDHVDALVHEAGRGGPVEHRELAHQLRVWAEGPHLLDGPSPRELFMRAGEQLSLAGDDEAALAFDRRAAASHGDAQLDPRCLVVELLHGRGEHDEADRIEQELRRSRPGSAATYEYMGQLCARLGETARALGWFNRGLSLAEDQGLLEAEMGSLCLARWRLRHGAGHDPDQFDQFGMDYHERVRRGAGQG